jgi:hypothetical protein
MEYLSRWWWTSNNVVFIEFYCYRNPTTLGTNQVSVVSLLMTVRNYWKLREVDVVSKTPYDFVAMILWIELWIGLRWRVNRLQVQDRRFFQSPVKVNQLWACDGKSKRWWFIFPNSPIWVTLWFVCKNKIAWRSWKSNRIEFTQRKTLSQTTPISDTKSRFVICKVYVLRSMGHIHFCQGIN